jgi:Cu+-exporting ATPase
LKLAEKNEAGKQTTTISVGGMSCAACVRRVEMAIKSLSGVGEMGVNLATARAKVQHAGGMGRGTGPEAGCDGPGI